MQSELPNDQTHDLGSTPAVDPFPSFEEILGMPTKSMVSLMDGVLSRDDPQMLEAFLDGLYNGENFTSDLQSMVRLKAVNSYGDCLAHTPLIKEELSKVQHYCLRNFDTLDISHEAFNKTNTGKGFGVEIKNRQDIVKSISEMDPFVRGIAYGKMSPKLKESLDQKSVTVSEIKIKKGDVQDEFILKMKSELDADAEIVNNFTANKIQKFYREAEPVMRRRARRDHVLQKEELESLHIDEVFDLETKRASNVYSAMSSMELTDVRSLNYTEKSPSAVLDVGEEHPSEKRPPQNEGDTAWDHARGVEFEKFDPSGLVRLVTDHFANRQSEFDRHFSSALQRINAKPDEETAEQAAQTSKKHPSKAKKKIENAETKTELEPEATEQPEPASPSASKKKRKSKPKKKKAAIPSASSSSVDPFLVFGNIQEIDSRSEMQLLIGALPMHDRRIVGKWIDFADDMRHYGLGNHREAAENYFDSSNHSDPQSKNFEWDMAELLFSRVMRHSPFAHDRHRAAIKYGKIQGRKLEDLSDSKLDEKERFFKKKSLLSEMEKSRKIGIASIPGLPKDAIFHALIYLKNTETKLATNALKEGISSVKVPPRYQDDPREKFDKFKDGWGNNVRNIFRLLSKCSGERDPETRDLYRSYAKTPSQQLPAILARCATQFAQEEKRRDRSPSPASAGRT